MGTGEVLGSIGPVGPVGSVGSEGSVGPVGSEGSVGSAGSVGPVGSLGLVGSVGSTTAETTPPTMSSTGSRSSRPSADAEAAGAKTVAEMTNPTARATARRRVLIRMELPSEKRPVFAGGGTAWSSRSVFDDRPRLTPEQGVDRCTRRHTGKIGSGGVSCRPRSS
ncbi:hypothetical protein DDQ50_01395 [Amnibacterium flavum]|uniref:Collagen-like protein n=1 Tax=Amnibacterium flavum TaxID=2173173 RepID=A0A2V1HU46_9MICO|nr:hypothetical protein DDQ50_01395 [Amnibacterium flavum]